MYKLLIWINQQLSELSIKYNSDDDYIYIKSADGTYVKWKCAMLKFDGTIFADGTFASGFSLGSSASITSGYTNDGGFSLTDSALIGTVPTTTQHSRGNFINGSVDLTNYNTLYVEFNGTLTSLNVSGLTGTHYLAIKVTNYQNTKNADVFVKTAIGTYLGDNSVGEAELSNVSTTTLTISKIYFA